MIVTVKGVVRMLFDEMIDRLAERQAIRSISHAQAPHIRDVWLLDGAQSGYDDDLLYFVPDIQLLRGEGFPLQCVVCAGCEGELPGDTCAAAASGEVILTCFNAARKIIAEATGFGIYESLMSVAQQTGSIDSVINTAATKLGNPIIFCDSEFRVISYSTTVPVIDPIWTANIENGYCPYEFVKKARSLESVRNAPMTVDAIEVTCTESPYRKLSSKVMLGGVSVGFVLMIASETGISLVHFDMLKNLSMVLTYAVGRYASYLLGGVGPYQQLMYQLLIGAAAENVAPQIALLQFPQTMAALCVRQTRHSGQQYLKESISGKFCGLIPAAHIAFYEGAMAAIIPVESGTEPDEPLLQKLRDFAEGEHLSIGVSYSFNNIENFSDHYRQALSSIDLAKRMGGRERVCLFRDYVFYDILASCTGGQSIGSRCHPALQKLRLHDSETGSDLYNTLRCYMETGGVVKDTAGALFIHRNSLNYRLELISRITGLDIDAPRTKLVLKLSFDMDRYSGMAD